MWISDERPVGRPVWGVTGPGNQTDDGSWAPVLAARGNNDMFVGEDPRVADVQCLDIHGFRIAMVHDMEPEDEPIKELRRKYLGVEYEFDGRTVRRLG